VALTLIVCWGDRLQHRPHVPRFNTDHRQTFFDVSAEKPLREWSGFQPFLKVIQFTHRGGMMCNPVSFETNDLFPNDADGFVVAPHDAAMTVISRC
jgi:hypothetical protein